MFKQQRTTPKKKSLHLENKSYEINLNSEDYIARRVIVEIPLNSE